MHLTLPLGFWETIIFEKKGCIIPKKINNCSFMNTAGRAGRIHKCVSTSLATPLEETLTVAMWLCRSAVQLHPSLDFLLQVYQTSQGYFVVTPEKRRRDSSSHQRRHSRTEASDVSRPMLMSTEEALAYVHGEMQTIRDGAVTHQAVQTNLADVICGGESPVAC